MTPTQLAKALREVEVSDHGSDTACSKAGQRECERLQTRDLAIIEEAAKTLEEQERMIALQKRLLDDYRMNYIPKER